MRSDAKPPTAASNHRLKQSGALAIAALLAMAAFAAPAFASQEVVDYFGNASGSGSSGGEFDDPSGVAVNDSGAGPADQGDIYVVDNNNHRVQRFDEARNFVSAWGADVALPAGGSDFEICTEAAECKAGVATGGNGTAAGNGSLDDPEAVAVDNDTGYVYVSDRDNRRVNVYDGEGGFLRSFGWDVAESGPGNTGTEYEVCIAAEGDVCKKGVGSSSPGVGQFHTSTIGGSYGIAVSPADGEASEGTVFLANSGDERVNTYDLDGSNPGDFGSIAEFGSNYPQNVTVDSRGIVYASNSLENAQIERYDTEDANGEGVGFLAPLRSPVDEEQKLTFSGLASAIPILGIPGDKFTLTCPDGEPTDEIEYESGGSGRSKILGALNASCGSGNFSATGSNPNPRVTFVGAYAATDVPTMTCTVLTGGGSCSVTEETDGHDGPVLKGTNTATEGLAVDPDSDGAGPDVDTLYVLRDHNTSFSDGNTVVQQFGPANEPGLILAPTDQDDAHGASAGFRSVLGLGLDQQTGRLLVSSWSETFGLGLGLGHRVYVLDDPASVPDAVATMDPITVKADSSATFSGSVDPMGTYTTCVFQYATNPEFAGAIDVEEPECASLAKGGGAQSVSQSAAGLVPNTTYFVRLRASHPFISADADSSHVAFATDPAPPTVTDVGAVEVGDKSARLVGTVEPKHSATGYVFEYGPTPALGSATSPLAIGDGSDPVTVSRVVSGLAKDTTYYFRLVATNGFGTTASVQASLHTRSLPLPLPANRAYEQVSPVEKNGGDAITETYTQETSIQPSPTYVGEDGEGLAFGSVNSFGAQPGQVLVFTTHYASHRGPDGWGTKRISPPACANDPTDPQQPLFWIPKGKYVSTNVEAATTLHRESAACTTPPLDPGAILPATNLYRVDLTSAPAGYDLLAPEPDPALPLNILEHHANYAAASDDFSHVVYTSGAQQTPDAPAGDFEKVFEWDNGALRLVSVDTDGEPFETSSTVPTGGPASEDSVPSAIRGGKQDMHNAVSASGDRIFIQNPVKPLTYDSGACTSSCELYLREAGAVTHHVSASECTSECGAAALKQFRWAARDGGSAFFTSGEKLVNDDPTAAGSGSEDLYVYRHSANPTVEPNLTLVSEDAEPADGIAGDVLGVMGVSDDGDTVYFIADNQLVPGAPTEPGQKTYRWDWNGGQPTLEYLTSAVQGKQFLEETRHIERRVSQDGEALMIETAERVVPAADSDADLDVYVWRVGRGWSCVSCQVPGVPSGGPSTTSTVGITSNKIAGLEPPLDTGLESAISADGSRVAFTTPDALVPADSNGPCEREGVAGGGGNAGGFYPCSDVYEWHDGRISLITPGTESGDVGLLGISADGRDVFFSTRESLVGWDNDEFVDIYDARIGGGFPEPPPQPPECEGEGCREGGTEAPPIAGAGTAVFQGAGNPSSGVANANRCPANRLRRGKRCLTPAALARKRCRRLGGPAKRRCIQKQSRRLRRAQRLRAQRAQRRARQARAANDYRRASR